MDLLGDKLHKKVQTRTIFIIELVKTVSIIELVCILESIWSWLN